MFCTQHRWLAQDDGPKLFDASAIAFAFAFNFAQPEALLKLGDPQREPRHVASHELRVRHHDATQLLRWRARGGVSDRGSPRGEPKRNFN